MTKLFHEFQAFFWNVPVKLKLKHPPPDIPRAFDCALCPGRGEFECCLGRVGNLNRIYLSFWRNAPVSFFPFLQGLTDLQDRISPLLVNNYFTEKGLQKKYEGVITAHLSLKSVNSVWSNTKFVFEERYFRTNRGGNLNKPIFKSSNAWAGLQIIFLSWKDICPTKPPFWSDKTEMWSDVF